MRKEFCRRSWLMGLALGLCGKPLPIGGGELVIPGEPAGKIVGYKYGRSDVFPDINLVWTDELKQTHPYAYVCASMFRYVMLTSSPLYVSGRWLRPYSDCLWKSHFMVDGYWHSEKNGDTIAGDTMITIDEIAWASIDVLNEDGTVYLATSEPVPVYE